MLVRLAARRRLSRRARSPPMCPGSPRGLVTVAALALLGVFERELDVLWAGVQLAAPLR